MGVNQSHSQGEFPSLMLYFDKKFESSYEENYTEEVGGKAIENQKNRANPSANAGRGALNPVRPQPKAPNM